MNWRTLFAKLVNRSAPVEGTTVHIAEFDRSYVHDDPDNLTITTIRATEGDSWQPPPAARLDPRRPSSHHW
jgi:hypothetical protein